jgi:hypothetical protein
MSDLLSDARDLRQKLYRLEVLLQIEKGRRSRTWFTGKAPEDPQRTVAMRKLVKAVRAKVGAHGELDWTRADEIDFSKL